MGKISRFIIVFAFIYTKQAVAGPDLASDFEKGCLAVSSQLSGIVDRLEVQQLLAKVGSTQVGGYLATCKAIAGSTLHFIVTGKTSNMSIAVKDGEKINAGSLNVGELLDIVGPSKSSPRDFARSDGTCPVKNDVTGAIIDSPSNCQMGCMYYYTRDRDPGFFLGFNAGWQLYYQSWRIKEKGNRYAAELKNCTDIGGESNIFTCAMAYCPEVHVTVQKFDETH